MTASMFFDMLQDMRVTIEYVDLSDKARLGEYIHARRVVRLHHDLSPRELPYVLGHETYHALNEDVPTSSGYFDERMERRADEWSATHCIDISDFKESEVQFSGHVPTMAFHLGVPDEAILVFRQRLQRIGDDIYMSPRMGTGQWAKKMRA